MTIREELQSMQGYLEITCSEDINEVVERGNTLSVFIARSGKMLADCKRDLETRLGSEVVTTLLEASKQVEFLSAKATNSIVDSVCFEEKYNVNWCERINRTATHQLEWCRTLISKAKAEMIAQR